MDEVATKEASAFIRLLANGYEKVENMMGKRQKGEKLSKGEKRKLAKQHHLGTRGSPYWSIDNFDLAQEQRRNESPQEVWAIVDQLGSDYMLQQGVLIRNSPVLEESEWQEATNEDD